MPNDTQITSARSPLIVLNGPYGSFPCLRPSLASEDDFQSHLNVEMWADSARLELGNK